MGKYPKGADRRDAQFRPSGRRRVPVPVSLCLVCVMMMRCSAVRCGGHGNQELPLRGLGPGRCRARSGGGDALHVLAGVVEVGKKSRADIVGMHSRNLKPKNDNNDNGGMPDRSPTRHQHIRSSVESGVSPTQPPWEDSSVVLHRRRVVGYGGRGPTGPPLFSPLLLRRRETNGCARPKAWAWASPGQDEKSPPSCQVGLPSQSRAVDALAEVGKVGEKGWFGCNGRNGVRWK